MKNYVLAYTFSDAGLQSDFENKIKKEFPRHKQLGSNGLAYFGFLARKEPEVEDHITYLIDRKDLMDNDVAALYFSSKDNPDDIKRVLIQGSDETANQKLMEGHAEHNNILIDLLEERF